MIRPPPSPTLFPPPSLSRSGRRGPPYTRRDVTGRVIANAYAQTLGEVFTQQLKPFEVELCVAEVGDTPETDQLYRLTFDGSVVDEPDFVVMEIGRAHV